MNSFSNTKIILVETSHPGNIGSAARAMKTMRFSNLNLVNPKCKVNEISYAMASNAGDVLDNVKIYENLFDAIGDCNYIIGATARQRDIPIEIINPREVAKKVNTKSHEKTAIVLGNEARGLTNEQLSMCTIGLHIPSNIEYTSLNIASSLQIILYEILFDSEYNTYMIPGLPPSIICFPGKDSLVAVSKPYKSDFLYFVSKRRNGEHFFSTTYKEHLKRIREVKNVK